ncbi:hypothetical protein HPT27_09705 [Permianibacter sp. IMCC34836]|uniref:PilN domain-containing protein n=1 Tax=Permianibacter fluminis TaxID=2738515 RepID=UPI001555A560|nr:hypothetical protein [Permianibacter fluminis]NQD37302.1 hypothetical protein [Permianibacter fluminis]
MQQINLFLAEFAPAPQRLTLRTLLRLLIGLLLVLVLIGAFLAQQLYRERDRSAQGRTELDGVIAAISQSHGNQQAQQNVAARLAQLRLQLTEQQALLADLQQREARQTTGFAPLLQTLAQEHDSRLWLTHIAAKNGRLQLAGETLNAAAVPSWLGKLQTTAPLQGQRFAGLSISRVDSKPGVLAFRLSPEPLATETESGDSHAAAQR